MPENIWFKLKRWYWEYQVEYLKFEVRGLVYEIEYCIEPTRKDRLQTNFNSATSKLHDAEETLNKIYAENRKCWDGQIKKMESELSEINGSLSTLCLPEKVALKMIHKRIPSIKEEIIKAKGKRDKYL